MVVPRMGDEIHLEKRRGGDTEDECVSCIHILVLLVRTYRF